MFNGHGQNNHINNFGKFPQKNKKITLKKFEDDIDKIKTLEIRMIIVPNLKGYNYPKLLCRFENRLFSILYLYLVR